MHPLFYYEVVMKDCVIGGCYGYNYDQIKIWINSINRSGFVGDKVLVLFDASEELVRQVKEQDFKVVQVEMPSNVAPHVMRFAAISDYLSEHDYRFVVTTDVRDVIFQKNPIPFLDLHLQTRNLVASSECLRYKDEPWGNQNLMETFGPYIYEKYNNNIIYNVGVLGGRGNFIRDLCLDIAIHSMNRPIKICDQAVFNFMMHSQFYKSNTVLMPMSQGWATHLGTVADPRKMYFFRPNLLEPEPEFKNNIVSAENTEVCFIHQYDRTVWKDELEKLYS